MWHNFTQQRLKAWQPVLDPKWIISFYLLVGVLFVAVGVVLLQTSQGVVEHSMDYTDTPVVNNHRVGEFEVNIVRDMEPPIWIYYQLDGFHQNHRRYVKSRDDGQMGEAEQPPAVPRTVPSEVGACNPWAGTDNRVNYPCGLVARSVFNDSFKIRQLEPEVGSEWKMLNVSSSASSIAWAADTDGKFQNLDPEKTLPDTSVKNEAALNMWMNSRFPPQTCEQTVVSLDKPWRPVYVKTKEVSFTPEGGSEQQVSATDCTRYMTDSSECNFERADDDGNMQPFDCQGDYETRRVEDWGIESGHFIVWMRIAGLPKFRKLWGKVDTPLKGGTTLNISFVDNFPVRAFHGRKALVLSTSSALGGKNDFLGYGYIVVGSICVIFGLLYLYRQMVKPREQGDLGLLSARQ